MKDPLVIPINPLSCLRGLYNIVFEVAEAEDRDRFGARIKWRRLCLLTGAMFLTLGAYKDWYDKWFSVVMVLWCDGV